jgi:protease-4
MRAMQPQDSQPSNPGPRQPRSTKKGVLILLLLFVVPLAMCAPLALGLGSKGSIGDAIVLELDLEDPIVEGSGGSFLDDRNTSSRDVVFALQRAAADPRVKGLYARIGGAGHGLATAMEVRDAVLAFRSSGKRAVAFSESFGELSPGTGGWFIASAFDEVWLQPAGSVSLAPLSAEGMFARDALEKVGIEPAIAARKEFKNAPNTFTEQSFTAFHREATLALLSSAQRTMTERIAQARPKLGDADAVAALLRGGPYTADEALAKGLVDKLGYRDEVMAAVKSQAGTGAKLLWLSRYLDRAGSPYDKDGPVVAVVSAIGQIHRGRSSADPLSGSQSAGSDTVAGALRQAIDDKDVKAIILRIDSPGGSVVASETIAREVQRATTAGKPVIATMANVAGSGGYYIAMNADVIIAHPGTITGSIGVYAGKAVTTKAWEKVGINFEAVAVDDADTSFFSTDAPYSDAARARLDHMVDDIYASFVRKVAAGRKRTFDEIEPFAHGRIWSGTDGKERFLVDELGGWPQAIGAARARLHLAADGPIRLVDFPAPKAPLAALLAMLNPEQGDSSDDDGAAISTQQLHLDPAALVARIHADSQIHGGVVVLTPALLEVLP